MKMKLKCSKSQKATNKKRVSRKSKAMEKHLEKKGCDYEWKLGSFLISRKATGARARVSLAFCMLFPCFFLAFSLLCMRVSWSPRTHLSAQLLLFFLLQLLVLLLLCRNCCKIADIFPMITYSQSDDEEKCLPLTVVISLRIFPSNAATMIFYYYLYIDFVIAFATIAVLLFTLLISLFVLLGWVNEFAINFNI